MTEKRVRMDIKPLPGLRRAIDEWRTVHTVPPAPRAEAARILIMLALQSQNPGKPMLDLDKQK